MSEGIALRPRVLVVAATSQEGHSVTHVRSMATAGLLS